MDFTFVFYTLKRKLKKARENVRKILIYWIFRNEVAKKGGLL